LLLTACGGTAAAPAGSAAASVRASAAPPVASSSAVQSTTSAAVDQLYQAAKKEGSVAISLSWNNELMTPLIKAFEDRFPGIKVDRFEINSTQGLERLITEQAAGKVSEDVIQGRSYEMEQVVARDLAATFDYSGAFGLPADAVLYDNRLVVAYQDAKPLTYNTKLVDAASAPKTWEDLLNPRWQGGKIVIDRGENGVYWALAKKWGEQKTLDFAKALHDQKPRYAQAASEASNLLRSGDVAIALDELEWSTLTYVEQGAPLAMAPAAPVGVSFNGAYAVKAAPHPNAAKLFVGWMATPESEQIFERTRFQSFIRPGIGSRQYDALEKLGVDLVYEAPQDFAENVKIEQQATKLVNGGGS
jgi:iron(III) transport system substrate-binding protein